MISNNNLSFEKYLSLKRSNELSRLALHKEHIQQSVSRYALVDNLLNEYEWDYWVVITFGYHPHELDVEQILQDAHYRFDRWLLTNNKLTAMNIDKRSRWLCLPEKGSENKIHYNCFFDLKVQPNVKTYGNEWNSIRIALKQTLKSLQKVYKCTIDFEVYERRRRKDALKVAIYSTKEMRSGWKDENNGEDHFANFIRSWKDWQVKPINKRSPKKITLQPKPSATLTQFMSD